jgi:hypothetical protein
MVLDFSEQDSEALGDAEYDERKEYEIKDGWRC